MTMKSSLLGAVALLGLVTADANATPFRLDYAIADTGTGYRYDFSLVLDNNDASWDLGDGYDWFVFGNEANTGDPTGAFADVTWLSTPSGFFTATTTGFNNGPTLCCGADCGPDQLYSPTAIDQVIMFSLLSSTFLGAGQLFWSNNVGGGPGGTENADFAEAVLTGVTPVPVPAALPLLTAALGALGFIGWRRRRKLEQKSA